MKSEIKNLETLEQRLTKKYVKENQHHYKGPFPHFMVINLFGPKMFAHKFRNSRDAMLYSQCLQKMHYVDTTNPYFIGHVHTINAPNHVNDTTGYGKYDVGAMESPSAGYTSPTTVMDYLTMYNSDDEDDEAAV